MSFADTLPERGRHLSRRLEAFGDIVFGFSISQLALQLGAPQHARDVFENPLRFVLFFGTFAIIATLWLRFHGLMATAFAPHRIDLLLAFTFLAFAALLPFALSMSVLARTFSDARYGFAIYVLCFLGTATTALLLDLRGLRRGGALLGAGDILRLRRNILLNTGICTLFVVSLVLDVLYGVIAGSFTLFLITPYAAIVRRRTRSVSWSATYVGLEKTA